MSNPTRLITLLQSSLMIIIVYPELYAPIGIALFALCLIRLIVKIGNGSFFLELLHVYAAFACVLMPLVGYQYYNRDYTDLIAWIRTMSVPAQTYFSFNIPATIAMGWGFFLFRHKSPDDRPVIRNLINQIRNDLLLIPPPVIMVLTATAFVAYAISNFLPDSLRQINTFLYYSLFACAFYIFFYRNFPFKWYFLAGMVGFIFLDAVNSGMFTIIAYMSGLVLILLIADKKILLYKKVSLLAGGLVLLSFIQLFKLDLRSSYKKRENATVSELATRVVSNSQESKLEALVYPIYQRMNQGFNISLVQRRIPSQVNYLGGQYLGLTFLSSFVPRVIWPDKPKAGGAENMRIYTGINIRTWSTNVGPFGEAYGNFGNFGGWVYVFVFSFFIRFAYTKFLDICRSRPIFFLWLPALFFQTFYVVETDSLQAFNSLIKGAVFMFAMYKIFPALFPKRQL